MNCLKPVLALALLGSVVLPAAAIADDRPDPAQPFFWQIVDRDSQGRAERRGDRFRGDDDDDDRGRRGDRDDDDDGGRRGDRGDDDGREDDDRGDDDD